MESKQLVVVIVVKLVHKPLLFCALYLLNLLKYNNPVYGCMRAMASPRYISWDKGIWAQAPMDFRALFSYATVYFICLCLV